MKQAHTCDRKNKCVKPCNVRPLVCICALVRNRTTATIPNRRQCFSPRIQQVALLPFAWLPVGKFFTVPLSFFMLTTRSYREWPVSMRLGRTIQFRSVGKTCILFWKAYGLTVYSYIHSTSVKRNTSRNQARMIPNSNIFWERVIN